MTEPTGSPAQVDQPSAPGAAPDPEALHPVQRLLGWSRLLVLLAVVGSFIASATLMIYGVVRAIGIIINLTSHVGDDLATSEKYGKELIAQTIAIVDMFLMGTVLFIVAAGMYQLFIDPRTALPAWLRIRSLDDLKGLLTGVIVVALLVTFLGSAVSWTAGTDIIALGLAIAAVVVAANMSMRIFARHGSAHDRRE